MDCPICNYKGLDVDATNCPSCNADLSAFLAIDAVETSMKKQKRTTLIFIILFILACMACVVIYFLASTYGTAAEDADKLATYETEIQAMKTENQQLKTLNANLLEENKKLKEEIEKAPSAQVKHMIRYGETLYIIARNYLGNGDLYPKIAADNDIENPDFIIAGAEIIINR
ncbi:MAG: LysM peptidoglycan-binding domain-containing protein [Bacteroidales bacterium]|nr:LysM peptidoglycan-binding domain-containing protein [Bacteroidales bacterium]